MIKKLVAFGCSWTYGDELEDPGLQLGNSIQGKRRDHLIQQYRLEQSFPGLVANHYNLQLDNYGFPGASEESIRYALNWYLKNHNLEDTIIIVAHTDPARKSWFNTQINDPPWNRYMHSPWLKAPNPDIDDHWYQLQKLWLGMCYHQDWVSNNFQETVRLFDWVRLKFSIPVIQIKALKSRESPDIDNFLYADTSMQEILTDCKEPFFPGGHPTESGHKILSKHLIDYIDSAKLV